MEQQFIPYNRWIHRHDEDIRQEYPDRKTGEMAQEMDVNYYTVSRRATRLGVSKSERFMHTSWKKGGGYKYSKYTEQSEAYMKEHFADTSNEDLAKRFGVDVKTVRRWARRLGLVKSEVFMQAARASGISKSKYYTPEQIAYRNRRIAEVYPDADKEGLQRLSDELGIKINPIRRLANDIGVYRNRRPQYLDELAEYFPTHTDNECAVRFCVKKATIQGIARRHGWKKTRDHLQKIYDSNIAAAHEHNRKKYG